MERALEPLKQVLNIHYVHCLIVYLRLQASHQAARILACVTCHASLMEACNLQGTITAMRAFIEQCMGRSLFMPGAYVTAVQHMGCSQCHQYETCIDKPC